MREREIVRERATQETKLKRKLFVTAKRVYYFGTLSTRDHTPTVRSDRGVVGVRPRTMVSARKESAKFYIWLAVVPGPSRRRPKPFLIKMLTGAAKNANTLDGANRERERDRKSEREAEQSEKSYRQDPLL